MEETKKRNGERPGISGIMERTAIKKRPGRSVRSDRKSDVPETENQQDDHLKQLDWLAELMDDRFRVPGTNIRFGLDSLVGLAPGIGDSVSSLVSAAIVLEVWRKGVPAHVVMRMCGNIALDFVLGSVPLVGDMFDVAWKANRRNLQLARKHIAKQGSVPTTSRRT